MTSEINKTKRLIKKLWIGTTILVFTIIIIYICKFTNNGFSDDPENWGQFGDFFGGTLNAILSIINFFVLTFLTLKIVEIEETRNSKILADSIKPVGVLEIEIGIDELKIHLYNVGLGPLFIKELQIFSINDKIIHTDFKQIIDKIIFTKYKPTYIASRGNETIIRKDQFNQLLNIDLQQDSNINVSIQDKRNSLELLKKELSFFKIRLTYTDMYKNEMEIMEDELSEITMDCN